MANSVLADNSRRPKWRHTVTRYKREYNSWYQMLTRCYDPRDVEHYPYYGGRGITVCEPWRLSFDTFCDEMGPAPPGTTVGRLDNDDNYYKGNCEWQTYVEQTRNRSNTMKVVWEGQEIIAAELAEALGVDVLKFVRFVWHRTRKFGHSDEHAIRDFLSKTDARKGENRRSRGMLLRINGGPILSLKEAGLLVGRDSKDTAWLRSQGSTLAESIGRQEHEVEVVQYGAWYGLKRK